MVRVMEFGRPCRQGSLPPRAQDRPLPQRSPTTASLVELPPLPGLQASPAAFQLQRGPPF